ncbi:hypothetical protein M0R45_035154 [Rubus argutus]|uniref:Uncharacterized protein n=1 Tax=Rubus argutus TaxID=59490 RepID=A0AAW1VS83_RUBAR
MVFMLVWTSGNGEGSPITMWWTYNNPPRVKYNAKIAGMNAPIEKSKGSKKLKNCKSFCFTSNHEDDEEKKGRRREEDELGRDAFRISSNSCTKLELVKCKFSEIINLRNLERVLAREEEVNNRAIVHKVIYTGPQLH